MSDDDQERIMNAILFHVPCTNKELEEAAPIGCGLLVALAIIAIALSIYFHIYPVQTS